MRQLEGILGLCHVVAINERMASCNSDYTTPCTFPNQHLECDRFEVVPENIVVEHYDATQHRVKAILRAAWLTNNLLGNYG